MDVEQSIFNSTKVMLDIVGDDDSFDKQIMTFINSALFDLSDLGVGPDAGLVLIDQDQTWEELGEQESMTEAIKNWLYLKVRLVFDPPQTSFLMEAHKAQIDEATWRLVNKKDGERYRIAHPQSVVMGGNS